MFRRFWILAIALAAGIAGAATAGFDADRYLQHIRFLASPEMRGRATGSAELEKAAEYIDGQFRADGLQPPPGTSGFLQPFQVTTSAKMGAGNRLDIVGGAEKESLQ